MRVRLNVKLASFKDFKWWMDKEELRFTHIASLMWVRLVGENAGSVTLLLGPLNVKLFCAWRTPQSPAQGGESRG